jgi:hypothetical protein
VSAIFLDTLVLVLSIIFNLNFYRVELLSLPSLQYGGPFPEFAARAIPNAKLE